jgi:hypothetical protein
MDSSEAARFQASRQLVLGGGRSLRAFLACAIALARGAGRARRDLISRSAV